MSNNEQFPIYNTTVPRIVLNGDKYADRLAVASFVCGIVGLISVFFSFIPGLLGYAFYLDAVRRGSNHSKLNAAKILCLLCLIAPVAISGAVLSYSCEAFLSLFV